MQKFTNPLNNIKIASPCSADWNKMYGDERKRHCSECKLNVYNLSDMTQTEAENFLINSEGRTCVKFYRRKDGTVLTKDCPVGWRALKKRVSRVAAMGFALTLSFFGGIFALNSLNALRSLTNYDKVPEPFIKSNDENPTFGFYGTLSNLPEIKSELFKGRHF